MKVRLVLTLSEHVLAVRVFGHVYAGPRRRYRLRSQSWGETA